MVATVQRDKNGVITHMKVGNEMMPKADAEKVLFDQITVTQVGVFLNKETNPKERALDLLAELLNEETSIQDLRKKILGF